MRVHALRIPRDSFNYYFLVRSLSTSLLRSLNIGNQLEMNSALRILRADHLYDRLTKRVSKNLRTVTLPSLRQKHQTKTKINQINQQSNKQTVKTGLLA